MHTFTALVRTAESTSWSPYVITGLIGAMVVVLGLTRLLRRLIAVVSSLLVTAGTAMTGLATMLTSMTVLAALFMVFLA
ncbi:MAG: hypothetical protein ABWY11_22305 [Umezawaea sp.]